MKKVSLKNILLLLVGFFTICLFLVVIFIVYGKFSRTDALVQVLELDSRVSYFETDQSMNLRQTGNDCGPFNATFIRNIDESPKNMISVNSVIADTRWRFNNGYTHPIGLEEILGWNIGYDAESLSDEDKIIFLKEELSKGNTLVLLGGRDDYQHYITILGYEGVDFHVYDSLHTRGSEAGQTIDSNGSDAGNVNFSSEELLEFWSNGGMYGFYEWYVVSVAMAK